MTFRTLGEAVLAAHRARQESTDQDHEKPSESRSTTECTPDQAAPPLSPLWAIRYFIAHRAR
jgi:hypothetical protein